MSNDLTKENPLRSSAIKAISRLERNVSRIKSALSSTKLSAQDLQSLSKLLQESQQAIADSQIEMDLASASPKQLDLIEIFLRESIKPVEKRLFKEFGVVGGNRSGKSYGGRIAVAKYLRDHAPKGGVFWMISPDDSKSISGQQKELWEALPRWMFGDQVYDEKNGFGGRTNTIVLDPNGRRVVVRFKTEAQYKSNPRSFEQEKVSGIWIDESIEFDAYCALRPRTIDTGGWILLTCIPDTAWLYDEFEEATSGSRRYYLKMSMMDNPHLPPTEIADAMKNWTEEERQMRVFGNFRFLSGLVYKEFIKEYAPAGHLCKPFPIPSDWPRWRMLDWGNAHPTACLWMAVGPDETIYIYREYVHSQQTVRAHANAIIDLSRGEKYQGRMIVDPALYHRNQGNMASIAEMFEKSGIQCRPGIRTNVVGEWSLVQKVKRRLEARNESGPMLRVFDSCTHLISEFRKWKYKFDKFNRPLGNDSFEDRWNDALDALKYGIAANPTFTGGNASKVFYPED